MVGWQADLNTYFHDVSGTVTIVDDDTIQVDNFTYDGGGISVFFYLGEEDSSTAFENGLRIGPQLVGPPFDGSQGPLMFDLPGGETLEGWNAISVWCVTAKANFGSGTFQGMIEPIPGDYNEDGIINAADYTVYRNIRAAGRRRIPNEGPDVSPGRVDREDYLFWREQYRNQRTPIPEPAALTLALCELLAVAPYLRRKHA